MELIVHKAQGALHIILHLILQSCEEHSIFIQCSPAECATYTCHLYCCHLYQQPGYCHQLGDSTSVTLKPCLPFVALSQG